MKIHKSEDFEANLILIDEADVNCPNCDSRLFYLEASFFCPECGYSIFDQGIDIES